MIKNTYKDLEKKYNTLKKNISSEEDKCASEGMSFEDMWEKTQEKRQELDDIDREMRLIQDPTLEFGKTWKGETITLDSFVQMSTTGQISDNDGYGYYATETAKSNIHIKPSDVILNKYRNDFTHVIWFEYGDE